MASENKRQNAGPKVPVALPKVESNQQSSTQTVSLETALNLVVGSRIRVNTAQPNQSTVEGTLYVADPITNLIVLYVSPAQIQAITPTSLHAPSGSYRVIPISQITSFQVQSLPQQSITAEPPATSNTLDVAALENRLKRTVAQLQTAQSKQGPKGTAATDQALFDALSRTMPTQWRGTSMIVSDTYIIDKPYHSGDIRFLEGASGDIDRIKKVLEMERSKIELRMGKASSDSTGRGALKKGG